jgi:hypothetical protein
MARPWLPECDGPKLPPFGDNHVNIDFVQPLSDDSEARHSIVWEVAIDGKAYALKMVSRMHLLD